MPNHVARPSELCEEFWETFNRIRAEVAPYLPDAVKTRNEARGRAFGNRLERYAEIDHLIGAVRRSGLPDSADHEVYRIVQRRVRRQAR